MCHYLIFDKDVKTVSEKVVSIISAWKIGFSYAKILSSVVHTLQQRIMCLNICMCTQKIPYESCFMKSGKTESRKQRNVWSRSEVSWCQVTSRKAGWSRCRVRYCGCGSNKKCPQEVSGTVLKGRVLSPGVITMITLIWESCLPPGHFAVLMWTQRQSAGLLFFLGWWFW